MYQKYIKRLLDIVLSLSALPFVCVAILIFGPWIYIEDKGSIFYKAKRRGKDGKIFNMYKLRSMKMNAPDIRNADNSTFSSEDDPRLTKIGKLVRRLSVDELPQVFNILKGDMSWIGPRPTMYSPETSKPIEELDEIRQKHFAVLPGITGYSQAFYRNSISQQQKYENDAYYADNISFGLDLRIIVQTVKSVIKRENIYKSAESGNSQKNSGK